MAVKKKPIRRGGTTPGSIGIVRNESLRDFGKREMGVYAEEVNLARAVPDLIDGLKPVQRRIMWAASLLGHDFVKTARLVGDVIGRFHPHGDKSVADAITTIVQSNCATLQGKGNWGSLIDPAAAMRYTNCRLSSYGWSFFDADYINKEVTSFVPNYDDTTHEPVSLPALLPNVLINGGEGIGVGTTTKLPTFTPESLVAVMTRLLKGEKLNSMDFAKTLKYANRYGGRLVNSKENKAAWLELFSGNSASIQFEARLDIDRDAKAIEIDDWPLGLNPVKFIEKVRTFQGVDQAFNHKGATGFRIEMNRSFNYAQFDSLVAKVQKATQVRRAFKINVTHRHSSIEDGVVKFDTKYLSLSVPQLLVAWLKERIALEKRSLEYRIKKQQAAIDYSTLLIFASNNLDHIFKSLRAPDSKAYLVKHLKLSPEDADKILELKVRQLSKLDQDTIKAKLKEQQAFMKQLRTWLASPKAKVLDDTQAILAAIEKDRKFEIAKDRKMSVAV
jgi:topoisomerase-4 subunit A